MPEQRKINESLLLSSLGPVTDFKLFKTMIPLPSELVAIPVARPTSIYSSLIGLLLVSTWLAVLTKVFQLSAATLGVPLLIGF